jgi:hypothetical protein
MSDPIPMFLTCPKCNARHIDEGVFATKVHHTHSCQTCGLTWRPAVVPTVGVAFLPGFKSEEVVARQECSECHGYLYLGKDFIHNPGCSRHPDLEKSDLPSASEVCECSQRYKRGMCPVCGPNAQEVVCPSSEDVAAKIRTAYEEGAVFVSGSSGFGYRSENFQYPDRRRVRFVWDASTPKAIEDESGRSLSPLSDERIARLASPADDKTDRREARAMAIEIEKLRLAYKEAIEERDTTGRCQHCPHCTGEPKASRMPYSAFAVGDVVAFVDRNPKYRIDALATRAGEPAAEMTMIRDQRGDAVLYKQLGGPASLKHAVVLPAGQFTSATQSP